MLVTGQHTKGGTLMNKSRVVVSAILAVAALAFVVGAQAEPKMETLKGTIIDLTCAAKGKGMKDMWVNAKENHMMPDGKTQANCATMCLKGGQPAALFDGKGIKAVLACNPRATLSQFSSKEVEIQGFWGGEKAFVPVKIRVGSDAWTDVDCATMHS
jgi:hypothetical protein